MQVHLKEPNTAIEVLDSEGKPMKKVTPFNMTYKNPVLTLNQGPGAAPPLPPSNVSIPAPPLPGVPIAPQLPATIPPPPTFSSATVLPQAPAGGAAIPLPPAPTGSIPAPPGSKAVPPPPMPPKPKYFFNFEFKSIFVSREENVD